jgi:acetyl esterase/lipase
MRVIFAFMLSTFLSACATQQAPLKTVAVASQIPRNISLELQKIGRVVAPPPTEALYRPLHEKEPYAQLKVMRDVRYGTDNRNLLDVFSSAATSGAKPVLIFVHGGAFTRGDRRTGDSPFYDNLQLWAVRNGMVGVNMTYRLAPQHTWPAAQRDIELAVRWVQENISAIGGDPKKIILIGHSAGAAHVAQYIAHTQLHTQPKGGIAGGVMISGIFDTTTAEKNPPLQSYFGKDEALYAERSALKGLVASNIPIFLAYAELDPEDFHKQTEQLSAALCKASKCPQAFKLMGHSHMSEMYAINTEDTSLTEPLRRFLQQLI